MLSFIAANDVDRPPGRLIYTQMLNSRGGIECDLTVARIAEDRYAIVTGTGFRTHDFAWIRQNTPENAFFALDPRYLSAPGEDYHSFRALAERSQLADFTKDAAVVTQVPELAPRWAEQVDAQAGWSHFQMGDFERLKTRFGVDWVVVSNPPPARLICRWHNNLLSACQVPDFERAPTP